MSAQFNCGLGPTIIRRTPGLPFSPDIPPERVPSDSNRARLRALRGVLIGALASKGLSASRSKSAWPSALRNRETPCGWPPAAMADGWFCAKRGAKSAPVMGLGSSTSQEARFSQSLISRDSWKASPSSLMNRISTGAFGLPSKIFRNWSPLIWRWRIRSRNCSNFHHLFPAVQ